MLVSTKTRKASILEIQDFIQHSCLYEGRHKCHGNVPIGGATRSDDPKRIILVISKVIVLPVKRFNMTFQWLTNGE